MHTGVAMSESVMPEWEKIIEGFDTFVANEDEWEGEPIVGPQKDDLIYRPKRGKIRYKAEYTVTCSPDRLLEILTNVPRRPEWDTLCAVAEVIGEEAHSRVMYYQTKPQWPTSAREEVLWLTRQDHEGRTYCIGTGCSSDKYKVKGEGVKMTTTLAGQRIESIGETDELRVVQVLDSDPGGLLPTSLTRRIATEKVPMMITKLRGIISQ